MQGTGFAWPEDWQWKPLLKGGGSIKDTGSGGKTGNNDASGSSNIVPDINDPSNAPAAYIYNDGAYMYYRLRLDTSPAGGGGQGVLQQFGWGLELDTNQNADNYEWLIMVDGIANPESVNIQKNTVQGTLGDPSDVAEVTVATYPLPGNHRILPADTFINGDQDYFLDFRIPADVFLSATGLTANSLVRYFAGTSKSANNLTDNGADLLGGSDLYNGLMDYTTASGDTTPCSGFTNGSVMFTNALDGFVNIQMVKPGDTIYIRVDDLDQTLERNPSQTVRVEIVTDRGDLEVVTLTATGVAGKFTGSIPSNALNVSIRNGILNLNPAANETVRVTYLDAITANCTQNVPRSATLTSTSIMTDLAVTKSVSKNAPAPGETVSFTVTITNLGPNNTTSTVTVTDNQPAGVTFGVATASIGSYSAGTWSIPSPFNVGTTATLTIPATVTAASGTTITNNAQINYASDGNSANNTATSSIYVSGTDLRVTQEISTTQAAEGDQVTYSVRVYNLGPAAVNGVAVTDLLPAGVTYVSHTAGQGTTYVGGTWNVGSLAVGAGALLTITATVNAGTAGQTIINTATLNTGSLSQLDTNAANNSASTSFVSSPVDLQITKTVDNNGPLQNANVTYTITVTNNGPSPASGIQVRDLLPAGVSYVSHTVSQGTFVDLVAPAGVPETWNVGSLAKNASATMTITVQVTAASGTRISNTASIIALNQYDTNTANNTAVALLSVAGADIQVTKQVRVQATPANPYASSALAQPNNTIEYLITVSNLGPNNATGLALTDYLPSGVSYVSSSASQGSYDGRSNGTKIWTIGSLNNGASATLTIVATVDTGATGTITNVGMITATGQPDPNENNNISSAYITINGTDLGISKSVDKPTPNVGDTVVYTITVTNYGPNPATNVQVTDLLPPELTFVSSDAGVNYNSSTGVWTVGTVPYTGNATNDVAVMKITAIVKSYDSNLQIKNTARITAVTQADPNTGNNIALNTLTVQGSDVAISINVNNAAPVIADTVIFTVKATNIGLNAVTGLEVEDILPTGLQYISHTLAQGTYSAGLWVVGSLPPGAAATIQITATVNIGTEGTTIVNSARMTHLDQVDLNTANNQASASLSPITPGHLTILKTADKASAKPGELITYTITITNTGQGPATTVVITDQLSPYIYWNLDSFGAGAPFSYGGVAGSGLTLDPPVYSSDRVNYNYTPSSGGGGAPAGLDGAVKSWKITTSGVILGGKAITISYQVMVK